MAGRLARARALVRNLLGRRRVDADLDDEVQATLAMLTDEKIQRGLAPDRARREALLEFGGAEQIKEEVRDARAGAGLEMLWQDVRYGARVLRRSPAFTAVAVLTLALGTGATTAMFSVVNAVLLQPLPFPDADRLIAVQERMPKIQAGNFPVSGPDVPDFRRLNQAFEDLGAYAGKRLDLAGGGAPERIIGARTSAALFRVLGVAPLLGRTFEDREDAVGSNVVLLGYAIWQRAFGGDDHIVGRTISINRVPHTVIGVMPASFEFPLRGLPFSQPAQVWVPIAFTKDELEGRGDNFNFGVIARLKPGVSAEAANIDMMRTAALVQKQGYPADAQADRAALEATATPLLDLVVGPTRSLLWLLLGAVSLLLAIACANVANLLLARGPGRRREMAVRGALGAGRRRLVRQLLIESGLLGVAGGLGGLAAAYAGVRAIVANAPPVLPRAQEISVDGHVLAFAVVVSLACGVIFGIIPAVSASRTGVSDVLKESTRGGSPGRAASRLRDAFVVVEIALAMLLVTGSGLLIRSFVRARATDPGVRTEGVLASGLSLPTSQYPQVSDVTRFFDDATARLATLPGVTAVATSSDLPLNSGWLHLFTAEGHEAEQAQGVPPNSHTLVSDGYFSTLGIPLVRGRVFTQVDLAGHANVVMVSEGMARRYWPGENPIGRRLKWGEASSTAPWLTIVGIVGDVKQGALDQPTMAHTYEPFAQVCQGPSNPICAGRFFLVRTQVPPESLVASIRETVRQVDPAQPLGRTIALAELVDQSLAPRKFSTMLLGLFASGALLLAAIGVYGVMAYSVSQRTREIGTRLALGAAPATVLWLILRRGGQLALVGLAIGVVASFGLTRLLTSQLFDVGASDPITFASGAAVLAVVALLACLIPARRAMRVSPLTATTAD